MLCGSSLGVQSIRGVCPIEITPVVIRRRLPEHPDLDKPVQRPHDNQLDSIRIAGHCRVSNHCVICFNPMKHIVEGEAIAEIMENTVHDMVVKSSESNQA
uniref:Uncharacterized protein n=1 Tax=Schlesneria paludicola TaxID=360056 RepID=A0A7C2PH79_9PLAN